MQELRDFHHGGTLATVTWLRARGQLADALTKAGRNTPLQQTIKTGSFNVRLQDGDYLSKSSVAAGHGGVYASSSSPDDGAYGNKEECESARCSRAAVAPWTRCQRARVRRVNALTVST